MKKKIVCADQHQGGDQAGALALLLERIRWMKMPRITTPAA